jgi:hypothetical protein
LIDANVLIRAHEDYYPLDRVPQFWTWLEQEAIAGRIKMPFEIHNEIAVSTGSLRDWICSKDIKEALVLDEEVDADLAERVLTEGYGANLTDSDLEKIGQDPFLIAYALAAEDRAVVTKEMPRPGAQRANRKIPDVRDTLNVRWMRDFDLYRVLQFTTAGL